MEGRTTLMWEGRRAALRLPELLPARTAHGMGPSSLFSTKCFAVFWFQIPGKSCACRRPTRRVRPQPGWGKFSLSAPGPHAHQQWARHPKDRGLVSLYASVFLE